MINKKALLVVISILSSISCLAASHAIPNYSEPIAGIEFVLVKGSCYQMGDIFGGGSSNEKPLHEVCVNDFYIGKYEVTQGQWKTVRGSNPSSISKCDDCPVEQVSWDDIQDFIRILNQRTGENFRLPTEAEWEYAARSGGKNEKWAGTNSEALLGDYAWFSANYNNKTHPVGRKKPNGLNIYDMSGNVWEWVQDVWSENYGGASVNPGGRGAFRVYRGGGWWNDPKELRVTYRGGAPTDHKSQNMGFRLAKNR